MTSGPGDFRKRGRLELHIPVRVRVKETNGQEWGELTHILDVTQIGASFTLEGKIEQGRILHMSLPLPWRLRQYDHSEELYRIYALVRWVRPRDDGGYAIGVAFVGKNPPASWVHDPSRIYGTSKVDDENIPQPPSRDGVDERREGRILAALMVQLDLLDDRGRSVGSEVTVTENISRHGASCYTSMKPTPGSLVRVTSQQTEFATNAVVLRCRTGEDNIARIHLEFQDGEWPLDIDEAEAN